MKKCMCVLIVMMIILSCTDGKKEKVQIVTFDVNLSSEEIGVNQLVSYLFSAVDDDNVKLTSLCVRDDFGWKAFDNEGEYRPSVIGDNKLTFIAINDEGDSTKFVKVIHVVPCDFYFGRWGDSMEDIKRFEDGYTSSQTDILDYRGGMFGEEARYYHFGSSAEGLLYGDRLFSYQTNVSNDNYNTVLSLLFNWETAIKRLTERYGAPTRNTCPDMTDWTDLQKVNFARNKYYSLGATFGDERTKVSLDVTNYRGQMWGNWGYTMYEEYRPIK